MRKSVEVVLRFRPSANLCRSTSPKPLLPARGKSEVEVKKVGKAPKGFQLALLLFQAKEIKWKKTFGLWSVLDEKGLENPNRVTYTAGMPIMFPSNNFALFFLMFFPLMRWLCPVARAINQSTFTNNECDTNRFMLLSSFLQTAHSNSTSWQLSISQSNRMRQVKSHQISPPERR